MQTALNYFGAEQSLDGYRVQDNEPGLNTAGEVLTATIDGEPLSGRDPASCRRWLSPSVNWLAHVRLVCAFSVNSIAVDYVRDSGDNVYVMSDRRLTQDRLLATVTIRIVGVTVSRTVPMSELYQTVAQLGPTGALRTVLPDVAGLSQRVVGVVAINTTISGDGTPVLSEGDFEDVRFARSTITEMQDGPVTGHNLRLGNLVVTRDPGAEPHLTTSRISAAAWASIRRPRI